MLGSDLRFNLGGGISLEPGTLAQAALGPAVPPDEVPPDEARRAKKHAVVIGAGVLSHSNPTPQALHWRSLRRCPLSMREEREKNIRPCAELGALVCSWLVDYSSTVLFNNSKA